MIHLRLRTEFSFRRAYGPVERVLEIAGGSAASITDNGTWGHNDWSKAARKLGIRPIFGAEIMVVSDAAERERQAGPAMAFLARNEVGLEEIYQLVSRANTEFFYYVPRVGYGEVNALSENVIILSGSGADLERLRPGQNVWLEINPSNQAWNRRMIRMGDEGAKAQGYGGLVVCADNYFPSAEERAHYEIIAGRDARNRVGLQHAADEWELRLGIPGLPEVALENTHLVAEECQAELPKASMVVPERPDTLYNLCRKGARERGLDVEGDPVYRERMERELKLIEEKGFEDYFYVIADMVRYAKEHMLVGPARGSSAGSLVCYLLYITDVDPIVHGLMFERFIDVTRADLPDVDIDFQDDRRDMVIEYLKERYSSERVGRIGTVNRYKAKSTISEVAKSLNVPAWEVNDVKEAIIERSSGDARAKFCIRDTLETLDIGKALVTKYPQMEISGDIEGHARHSGQHAAGILITQDPISHYGSTDRSGAIQLDKIDAEDLNLLKIDALGLRTLTVIQDTLDQVGLSRQWLLDYPLDDMEAFNVLNNERFSGIFQFEGYALMSITNQMKIRTFSDIVAVTSLARPGPLHCGATGEFIARRLGHEKAEPVHALAQEITDETYGTVVYQEQVMAIGRKIGKLSWEEVSALRKAMSRSLGEEFFNQYWEKFKVGAEEQGISEPDADRIWKNMCTFGSWAFNKSHAVSYGMVSYWCCVLKSKYPLEFAAATLRNAKDEEQSVKVLRDLVKEGFSYVPVDPKRSGVTWSVVDGKLLGGLTNIKGIGVKKAEDILRRRAEGKGLTPGLVKKLMAPETPYDDIFEGERRFGDMYRNPKNYNILSGNISHIKDISDPGDYVFIAKLKAKNIRDMNEYNSLVKRGGRVIKRNSLFLNLVLEDDTGSIIAQITRYVYPKLGKPIMETGRIGDWYLFRGKIMNERWRIVVIDKLRKLD